jgi:hypothetical protein
LTLLRSVVRHAPTSRDRAPGRSRFAAGAALTGAVAAFAMAAATSVQVASACSDAAHCYAAVQQNDGYSGNNGLFAQIRTNCINGATDSRFVTNEIWAATTNGERWIETGIARGAQNGSGGLQYFWARRDPTLNPPFRSWRLGAAPANEYPVFSLQLSGPYWWAWAGGSGGWQHTSAVTTPLGVMTAGAETNSNYTASWGAISSLQYLHPNGNWYYGVPGGGAVTTHAGMRFQWMTAPYYFREGAGNVSC